MKFEELKAEAQKYADLAFVRPLTDEEHKTYRGLMEKMFGKKELARALGETND